MLFYASIGLRADLAKGDSLSPPQFSVTNPLTAILGDSLPDGHYYVVATLNLNSKDIPVPAGSVFLSRTVR